MENLGVPSCLAVAIAKLEYDRGEGTTAAQPVIASQLSLDYFDEGDHKTSFKAPLWFIGGKTAFEKDLDKFYLGNMPNMLEKASAIKALLQAEEKTHAIQDVTPAPTVTMPLDGAISEVHGVFTFVKAHLDYSFSLTRATYPLMGLPCLISVFGGYLYIAFVPVHMVCDSETGLDNLEASLANFTDADEFCQKLPKIGIPKGCHAWVPFGTVPLLVAAPNTSNDGASSNYIEGYAHYSLTFIGAKPFSELAPDAVREINAQATKTVESQLKSVKPYKKKIISYLKEYVEPAITDE